MMTMCVFPGRDSVMALMSRNDLETRQELPPDQRDDDFLKRIEHMLIRDQSFFDIAAIRASFQNHDRNKSGKISTSEVKLDRIMLWSHVIYKELYEHLIFFYNQGALNRLLEFN